MFYLITEMMMCLLVAALLGLGMGYILWGLIAARRKEEIKALNETATARAVESETLTKQAEQLTATQAKAAATITEKEAEAARLIKQIGDLETQIAQNRNVLQTKESAIARLNTQMAGLEAQLAQHRSRFEELGAVIQKKEAEVAHLTHRIGDLEGHTAQLRANLLSKDSEIAGHLQMHTEKDRQLSLLKAKAPELEATQAAALAEKEKQLQTLRNKIGELQAAHEQASAEKNERLLALRSKVEELERAHADKDAHLAHLNAKLADFQPAEAAGAASVVQPSLSSAAGAGGLAGYMLQPSPNAEKAEALLGSLFEPLNEADVSRLASQMKTGSEVEDWLQAERHLRFERLESVQRNWSELHRGGD